MSKYTIKGNLLSYDENSINQDLEDILRNRFINGELDKDLDDLYDPYLLPDMQNRVNRVFEAKDKGQRVMIFGDYDVDGITSTSIMMHFLKKIGIQASYRLPDRVKDGYGMKKYFIDEIHSLGVSLIITVDCGTKDAEIIKYAKELGIDAIVTDHHAVPEIIPKEAIAIINPKRKDSIYPFKELSGAGVAFKLVCALASELFTIDDYKKYLIETIDIAAIGTVADCMPIVDENRIIVKYGLEQIKNSRSLGIRKLIENKINSDLDADLFGFFIGPRLNATGRLDTPYKGVNLILNNGDKIDTYLYEIEQINNKRKELTTYFYNKSLGNICIDDNVIFYDDEEIDHGIIGIIAGRLTENYFKPSIVLKDEGDKLVASCRSPDYFNLVEYLDKYKSYFLHFGGHKQARGFSISKEKFIDFKNDFLNELNKIDFSMYKKNLKVDKIISPEEIGFNLLNKINKYKPYGFGNTKPIFMLKDFDILGVDYIGKTFEHITIKNKFGFKIMGFFMGDLYEELRKIKKIDIIFDISEEEWMGKRNITLKIVDLAIV